MSARHLLRSLFLLLSVVGPAAALEFQPLGFESISMGGAGVASARGSMAAYYNPALLAKSPHAAEANLGLGVAIKEYNLVDPVNRLSEMDLDRTFDRMGDNVNFSTGQASPNSAQDRQNIREMQQIITGLGTDNGFWMGPSGSLGLQIGGVSIGAFALTDVAGRAVVSPTHNQLLFYDQENIRGTAADIYFQYDPGIPGDPTRPERYTYNAYYAGTNNSMGDQGYVGSFSYDASLTPQVYQNTSLQYAIENPDTTGVEVRGIGLVEVPVSYARRLPFLAGNLAVGASLKYMRGITYYQRLNIDSPDSDLADAFDQNGRTSSAFGVDVGALYQPPLVSQLSAGLVIKNLNSPSFDIATAAGGTEKLEVKPMARAGAAFSLGKLNLAGDLDLTENDTADGRGSRYLGLGLDYQPASWFSLRGGLARNLADSYHGNIFTAGLGFGVKRVQLDVAAQWSTKRVTVKGDEYPAYGKVNLALVSRW
ncbi:MAG: conjugal transfer protein TraF [Armatimonadetes bacterium]|nr:conjugal transfer protein TraF [Armatimonadota bacterium]